jgi:hypothetical protein
MPFDESLANGIFTARPCTAHDASDLDRPCYTE